MIGSPLTATFTLDDLPLNLSTDLFTWSVTGEAPFSDYDPTLISSQYTPYTPPSGHHQTTSFYFAQPMTEITGEIIRCSATLLSLGVSAEVKVKPTKPEFGTQALALGSFELLKEIEVDGLKG